MEAAAITRFRLAAQAEAGVELPDYDALHAWSVAQPQSFWPLLASFAGLPLTGEVVSARSADPMPFTRWFEGATLNYARALLYPEALGDPDQAALIGVVESGQTTELSFRELRREVAAVQGGLRAAGVGRGDAVAAFAANVPETVVLLLACAGLGAVFTSCSPDFGTDAATARFSQLQPKLLFATTAYSYGGKWFDTSATVARLAGALGTAAGRTIALPYPNAPAPASAEVVAWREFLAGSSGEQAEPQLEELPFDHPLYVLYSSGTTGTPKALVHRAGGALLTHAKEHLLHSDIGPGDRAFYFTTCGWMMWNWLVSALARGATLVLYDGSPSHPHLERPFELVERHEVTFFGTSARYLHTLKAEGRRPGASFDLGAMKTLASTGSPLSPDGFRYVYRAVKSDVHLASISGGTDIVGCFMLGVPTLPVYAGEIQRPGLGVDLAVLDEDGEEVVGRPGELVCRQPLPSMPLRFVGDPDFARYRASYLEHYPGLWRHGDLVERTPTGGIVVHGRSDATLNPGGVRIGTAEIYRALEAVPEVIEAAAVAKHTGSDQEVWLLVVLADGAELSGELERRIKGAVRSGASPRHVPARVLAVASLPRTRSGKSMEIAVTRLVNGQPVTNTEVVGNPESLAAVSEAVNAAANEAASRVASDGDDAHDRTRTG